MSVSIRMPWERDELLLWDIVGMNHYWMEGSRHLFVAMTRDSNCIRAEGVSEAIVFEQLARRAMQVEEEARDESSNGGQGGDVPPSGSDSE